MYFPHGGLGLYCRFHVLVHVRVYVRIYKNVSPQLKEGSIVSKEKEGRIIADQIFKRIAALNSDHGPVLGRLVRCLGFLVLHILWIFPSAELPRVDTSCSLVPSVLSSVYPPRSLTVEICVIALLINLIISGQVLQCFHDKIAAIPAILLHP
jgi:hypothetical protein